MEEICKSALLYRLINGNVAMLAYSDSVYCYGSIRKRVVEVSWALQTKQSSVFLYCSYSRTDECYCAAVCCVSALQRLHICSVSSLHTANH